MHGILKLTPDKDARVETSGGTTGGGGTIQASLGGRYATALFDLARQQGQLTAVESSLKTVSSAMTESADLSALVKSPLVGRDDAARAIAALVPVLGLDPLTANFLGVLAQNRRLGDLPAIIRAFRDLAARSRGETNAEVVSAHPLDDSQVDALKQQLRHRVGREVAIDLKVDPTLLGGLVVKIGSQMIDSSIKTRLNTLAHAMKG
ncbi:MULTISPECIES: F0F1 ATP synthase subunit delta [Sphingomonas]|jgi:F-type H+-transporting ATPase subunit delta|uniref:F0F1 ATP synthase subunit delta n=1 Tax=unclassified Sphingomonas TaxID=196159 RepID=UPI0009FFE18F|nr:MULTISPECIES: F0F1 ATP synthase subunit delta [Sphingomonas]PZT95695.1 MAG: F0F1 ATP synthase subunit delta [Sphingomonas sp.]RSV32263.1 F0F1 ATP synthase subunit delta [Sphingomonas sp. ABOLH]